jgi:hypothetical protein
MYVSRQREKKGQDQIRGEKAAEKSKMEWHEIT